MKTVVNTVRCNRMGYAIMEKETIKNNKQKSPTKRKNPNVLISYYCFSEISSFIFAQRLYCLSYTRKTRAKEIGKKVTP